MEPNPIQEPLSPQEAKGNCAQCQTSLSLPMPPIPIFNDPTVSGILIPHPHGIECPNCGLYHNLVIHPATAVVMAIVPMQKPLLNDEKKVIPFSGHLRGLEKGN